MKLQVLCFYPSHRHSFYIHLSLSLFLSLSLSLSLLLSLSLILSLSLSHSLSHCLSLSFSRSQSPDLMHHMTTQISPSLLSKQGIPIYQMKHEPGTFLVTFPKAYHAGFSYGFNVGEAVNFATYDWLSSGGEAEERYRTFARNSVFSHQRLLFTLFHHKADVAAQFHTK